MRQVITKITEKVKSNGEWIALIERAKKEQDTEIPLIMEDLPDELHDRGKYSPIFINKHGDIFCTPIVYNSHGLAEREGHIRSHASNGNLKLVGVILRFFSEWSQ